MSYGGDSQAYCTEHDITIGSTVEVMREPTANEIKEINMWVEEMSCQIGEQFVVEEIELGDILLSDGYWYPYMVLRKVE